LINIFNLRPSSSKKTSKSTTFVKTFAISLLITGNFFLMMRGKPPIPSPYPFSQPMSGTIPKTAIKAHGKNTQ